MSSSLLSDGRLVRRAAAGEERAFAAIFDRYHQPLYRYCLAIVGDAQDAQDALQNTMLKVLNALPGEAREIKLKPWLYRIAHNESVDLLRRRRDTAELAAELAAPGPPLVEELSVRERLRQLLADLDQLPERQRGALVMRELAGLDFEGIATALGTSSAVARQTLYEARLSLHRMDEGRDMDCTTVTRAISDGDGRVIRRRDVRAHLRSCADCRRFRAEIEGREQDLAAIAPLPAAAAAGLLQALLGGGASAGGTGAAGAAVAGGAAKTLGSSAALKGAAAILAVAAIGTGAAERSGLVDLGLPGGGSSQSTTQQVEPHAATGAAGPSSAGTAPANPQPSVAAGKPASGKRVPASAAPAASGNHASGASEAGTEASPATTEDESATHPHGKGHQKQHPAAAAHGQQTAVAHRETHHGASDKGLTSHPEHPVHPSGGEKGPAGEKTPGAGKAGPPAAEAGKSAAAPGAKGESAPGQNKAATNP